MIMSAESAEIKRRGQLWSSGGVNTGHFEYRSVYLLNSYEERRRGPFEQERRSARK
jgi:hypothetical protein